jgi:hypothetical protein
MMNSPAGMDTKLVLESNTEVENSCRVVPEEVSGR